MSNVALGIFLILFGATMIVSIEIPKWFIGLLAVITGLLVLFGGRRKPKV